MQSIKFSFATNIRNAAQTKNCEAPSFRAFIEDELQEHLIHSQKENVPVFSPRHFKDGHRSADNVIALSRLFVYDVDEITVKQLTKLCDDLDEMDLNYAVISSHSYTTKKPKVRFFIELNREPTKMDWPIVFQVFHNLTFDGLGDEKCGDIARCYFYPSTPNKQAPKLWYTKFDGVPFDLDEAMVLVSTPPPESPLEPTSRPEARIKPDLDSMLNIFTKWSRLRNDAKLKTKGQLGLALLNGKDITPLAPDGRHIAIRDLFYILALLNPEIRSYDGEGVATACLEGIEASKVQGKNDITFGEVAHLFDSAVEKAIEAENQAKAEKKAELIKSIRNHFRRKVRLRDSDDNLIFDSRGYPITAWEYPREEFVTPQEMDSLTETLGVTSHDEVAKNLIFLSKGNYYFLQPDGSISPFGVEPSALVAEATKALAVFHPYVEVEDTDQIKLLKDNTTQINNVKFSYIEKATYDYTDRSVTFPTGELFDGPARMFEDFETYLEIINTYNGHDLLSDWLAALPILTSPVAALLLEGKASGGKTLLANICAKYFGKAPVNIDDTTGSFTEELLYCPVVLGDESPGQAYLKNGTRFLRSEISKTRRRISRKFLKHVELEGALRYIFTCNSIEIFSLSSEEGLNNDDLAAFGERVLHIKIPEAAVSFLQSKGGRDYVTQKWIREEKALESIKYLNKSRALQASRGKLLVEGRLDSDFNKSLFSQHGMKGDVLMWCFRFLAWHLQPIGRRKKNRAENLFRSDFIFVEGGLLWVQGEAIHDLWEAAFGVGSLAKRPSMRQLQQMVKSLSIREKRVNSHRVHAIDPEKLLGTAEEAASIGRDGVMKALQTERKAESLTADVIALRPEGSNNE